MRVLRNRAFLNDPPRGGCPVFKRLMAEKKAAGRHPPPSPHRLLIQSSRQKEVGGGGGSWSLKKRLLAGPQLLATIITAVLPMGPMGVAEAWGTPVAGMRPVQPKSRGRKTSYPGRYLMTTIEGGGVWPLGHTQYQTSRTEAQTRPQTPDLFPSTVGRTTKGFQDKRRLSAPIWIFLKFNWRSVCHLRGGGWTGRKALAKAPEAGEDPGAEHGPVPPSPGTGVPQEAHRRRASTLGRGDGPRGTL